MAEGSNFDYLFKVRALQPGQEGQDIDWTLHAQIGRPHRRLWSREVVRVLFCYPSMFCSQRALCPVTVRTRRRRADRMECLTQALPRSALAVHSQRVQPGDEVDHRCRVRYPVNQRRREDVESTNLGHW